MSEYNTKGTYIKSWHAWICARLFPLDQIIKHPLCPEYVKRELIMLGVICFLRAAVFCKVRFTCNGLYNLGLDTAGYVRILDCGKREPQQGEVSKKDINHLFNKFRKKAGILASEAVREVEGIWRAHWTVAGAIEAIQLAAASGASLAPAAPAAPAPAAPAPVAQPGELLAA